MAAQELEQAGRRREAGARVVNVPGEAIHDFADTTRPGLISRNAHLWERE